MLDLILTIVFSYIKKRIRLFEKVAFPQAAVIILQPGTDGDPSACNFGMFHPLDRLPHFFQASQRLTERLFCKNDREFLTAVACHHIIACGFFQDDFCHSLQHRITRAVPKIVIDAFEIIDIQHRELKWHPRLLRLLNK